MKEQIYTFIFYFVTYFFGSDGLEPRYCALHGPLHSQQASLYIYERIIVTLEHLEELHYTFI